MNTPKVSDIAGIINKMAPPRFAEEWDNVGLQVGDAASPVDRIMVALDPTLGAVAAATDAQCQLLLTHHPLIFSPLKRVVASDAVGAAVTRAIRHGLAVFSLHTNYDMAVGGVNDLLAEKLGVTASAPLKVAAREELVKLSVFVPLGHEEGVLEELFRFGAPIGNYRDCSFRTAGTGTFRPLEGAAPFVGEVGKRAEVEETRVEVLLRGDDVAAAVAALRKAHPYEEPAYDLFPLLNRGTARGHGRIGVLEHATTLDAFAAAVGKRLDASGVRYVGDGGRKIQKVALCGGSGAFLLREALYQGADVLVTGDVKYHEAREAEALGVAVVDAGHFATELPMAAGLAASLGKELATRGFSATITVFEGEKDPFSHV
ncbi:MAG TPA: Nif3-like dinuclear metal center hexameric protein [Geobacteraceae bacterium]